jgi:hypothetical protein
MKRRDFFSETGCGILGTMMAFFGLTSCKKKEEAATETTAQAEAQTPAREKSMEEVSRKDLVKQMLIEKKGATEEEADAMLSQFEEILPKVEQKCICKTCPTYLAEETEEGFCHPLIGKSSIITEEKGCDCPQCPVHKEQQMKNGYYCTRKSELEQEIAKMA